MELRSAEEGVQEMLAEYRRLGETEKWHLPEIISSDKHGDELSLSSPSPQPQPMEAGNVLSTLESLHERLNGMKAKMDRFRKRLGEKDPITEAPRYGENASKRVHAVLTMYDALTEVIALAFGESEDGGPKAVVPDLRLAVAQQEAAARRAALEQEELRKQQEKEQEAEEERRIREGQRQQEEARSAQAREDAERARRAREARAAREEAERRAQERERRMREEAERVDREWMDSITKGPDGVREQLQKLGDNTSGETLQTALNALRTLFSQIVSHPEEPKFRRVRRDHVQFDEEIGQHPGGRELLIAAGFRLGAIDDIPCFISTEPDIEKEMDAWSEWFDLLKVTLNLLEQEMLT